MALIARIQHPYIVEFKEAWVEKVRTIVCILDYMIKIVLNLFIFSWIRKSMFCNNVGLLCLYCHWILWRWRHVSYFSDIYLQTLNRRFWFLSFTFNIPHFYLFCLNCYQGRINEKVQWDLFSRRGSFSCQYL